MSTVLSLIIPCYNEENTIEICVERTLQIHKNQCFALELIIIDDASTDKSFEKINALAEKYTEIKILKHSKNKGKGASLRSGFGAATGDYIGIQDADEEYNPLEYVTLVKTMISENADVVYGSRYLQRNSQQVFPFVHTLANKSLTTLSNIITRLRLTDMETCYKLFRKEVIHTIAPTLKENRFGFEPEVTIKIAQNGYKIHECAISYNPRTRKEGKKIGWKDGVRTLYCLVRYGLFG
ncbi:MAG: glycosyltransferase family 2 protein [Bacteroidetes bacterium]|nr:glycosyltransferase family 2 protein [Bacteroidota bacterium]